MRTADLTLDAWDALSDSEREHSARSIAASLPRGFSFAGLAKHRSGNIAHTVARFRDPSSAEFVLVPGGRAELGWDRALPPLTPEQSESWRDTAEEYQLDLERFLDANMTPRRSVELAPFLLETESRLFGYTEIKLTGAGTGGNVTVFSAGSITKTEGGKSYRVEWQTQDQVRRELSARGFRLPTSDEWEHACRAGSRTLFRWGDQCPADCYPIDQTLFDAHRLKNALGLSITHDPYAWELCEEDGVLRGGDGGSMICGGAGFFAGWLPLASAWLDASAAQWRGEPIPDTRARRALSLEP